MCSGNFETIERMTQSLSACSRIFGNRSEIGSPLSPPGRNVHGEAMTEPTSLNCVGGASIGIGLPSQRSSSGFGSNVSIWAGPPSM